MRAPRTTTIVTAAVALGLLATACSSDDSEATSAPAIVSLVVKDVDRSIEFYRLLGLTIPDEAIYREGDVALHVGIDVNDGLRLDLDSFEATARWAPDWQPSTTGARGALSLVVADAAAVDTMFAAMTAAGHPSHVAPFDAAWGARFAVVVDPDGHLVGFMSPAV